MFTVNKTPPFNTSVETESQKHPNLKSDIKWLEDRLKHAPDKIGNRVAGLQCLLPVFKTRCKDSCCNLGARAGWRIYYAIDKAKGVVHLLFSIHKKDSANPNKHYLQQKIDRAFFNLK